MCVELVAFAGNNPSGFARSVALKGVVHKLYEYNLLSDHLLRRVASLAKARDVQVSDEGFKAERRDCRAQFKRLRSWSSVRNAATGHYDKNTAIQVESLASIDPKEVMHVFAAFIQCNMSFLRMLAKVGRRNGT
jgi:hypothetical protein